MLSKLTISTKLVIVLVAMLVFLLTGTIGGATYYISQMVRDDMIAIAHQVGLKEKEKIQSEIKMNIKAAEQLASSLNALIDRPNIDREAMTSIVEGTLLSNKDLNGSWGIIASDALDGRNQEFSNKNATYREDGSWRPYFFPVQDGYKAEACSSIEQRNDDTLWYWGAVDSGQTYVTEPFTWVLENGETATGISFSSPLRKKGTVIGTAGNDIMLTLLAERLRSVQPFGVGSVYLLSQKAIWINHSDMSFIGKHWSASRDSEESQHQDTVLQAIAAGQETAYTAFSKHHGEEVYRLYIPVTIQESGAKWSLVVNIPVSIINQKAEQVIQWGLILGCVLIVLLSATLLFVGNRMIRQPLTQTVKCIHKFGEGQLDADIPNCDRQDEVGEINRALVTYRDNAIHMKALEEERLEANKKAAAERKQVRLQMADDFEKAVGAVVVDVSQAANKMTETAEHMTNLANDASAQSSEVANIAEEAAANSQAVSSATDELSASIREISGRLQEASKIVRQASDESQRTDGLVKSLSEATDRIGEVSELISGIADQTNLLALNATIEAARAGDAGKGFAVVAGEVKTLAQKTAKATEEISQQISTIQTETRTAVSAISSISGIILRIDEITAVISAAVEEQNAATGEIARNVNETADGTQRVSEYISQVQHIVGETKNSSLAVQHASSQLSTQSSDLQGQLGLFLDTVRG